MCYLTCIALVTERERVTRSNACDTVCYFFYVISIEFTCVVEIVVPYIIDTYAGDCANKGVAGFSNIDTVDGGYCVLEYDHNLLCIIRALYILLSHRSCRILSCLCLLYIVPLKSIFQTCFGCGILYQPEK